MMLQFYKIKSTVHRSRLCYQLINALLCVESCSLVQFDRSLQLMIARVVYIVHVHNARD